MLIFLILLLENFSAIASEHCVVSGCTNYWNFENNIGDQSNPSISLYNSFNVSWVNNRRGEKESALYLNNGYFQINSSSVSWTSDFSITAWIFVKTRVACGKLLDCGIKAQNELVINLNSCNGDGLALQLYTNRSVSEFVYNRNRLEAKWQHVAFTLNRGKIVIYTDGVPVASGTTNIKPNVISNYGACFIGKSQWSNLNINAYIDDLWMFNRGLSSEEVQIVMNSSTSTWTTEIKTSTNPKTSSQTTTIISSSTISASSAIHAKYSSTTSKEKSSSYSSLNNLSTTSFLTSSTVKSTQQVSSSEITTCSTQTIFQIETTPILKTTPISKNQKINSTKMILKNDLLSKNLTSFSMKITSLFPNRIINTTLKTRSAITISQISTILTTTTLNPNDKMMVALSEMKLINHWNFDNNYLDLKSGKPLLIKNTSFIKDRFLKEKSAIAFNFGQMRIPGFYFRGSFSVLVWIYVSSVDAIEQRLLYCLDQNKMNNLILTLQAGNKKYSYFSINDQKLQASEKLPTRTWVQVGATLDSNRLVNIWYNGKSVRSATFKSFPQNLTWTECYVGYNSDNADNFNLFLDDLMLFSNGLSEDQVNLLKENAITWPKGPIANWELNDNCDDRVSNSSFFNQNPELNEFVPDRNGQVSSSLLIKNATLQINNCPKTSLAHNTLMFWIFSKSQNDQGILEFNDFNSWFNIVKGKAYLIIDNITVSEFHLPLNEWTHLATTQDGVIGSSLYVNGESMTMKNNFVTSTRGNMFKFGKTKFPLFAIVDDIMLFDHALSSSEVQVYLNT